MKKDQSTKHRIFFKFDLSSQSIKTLVLGILSSILFSIVMWSKLICSPLPPTIVIIFECYIQSTFKHF